MNQDQVREATELVAALEDRANEVIELAHSAAAELRDGAFALYSRFRERVQDFDSLASLIEHRLEGTRPPEAEKLNERFAELSAYMLGATISTSLHFLRIFAERDYLPLGSKEAFLRELRSLNVAKRKIQESPYLERLGEVAAHDLKVAEEILDMVIDRAPELLDFTDMAAEANRSSG